MSTIKKILAYEILDSRGFPTIEARLITSDNRQVNTSIPAGTSVGKYEAVEVRDNDPLRFNGMGVQSGVSVINDLIGPKLAGVDTKRQADVDQWLNTADGTKNKSKLGGNVTLAISQLMVKAGAMDQSLPLFYYVNKLYEIQNKEFIRIEKIPTPIFDIINGGKHANNTLEFQEFQIIPSSSLPFARALQIGAEIFHELKDVLLYRNANISVGEEGGFAPNLSTNIDAFELIQETISQRGLKPGLDVFFGLDAAANSFFKNDKYMIKDKPHALGRDEYLEFLLSLTKSYPFLAIEDPLEEDDFTGWSKFAQALPTNIYLIGDDLLAANKTRLSRAIKEKSCTTMLVKPNQIGTISEVLDVIHEARQGGINYVISHRSGETNDTFVADFAVGVQADFVKFGAPSRGERVSKYNRLWRIVREELKI
ncbi:phosphopyruvate hydratase [Candidatus Microgenomates bacterium]|nr:phosphopyruvate hydratase [Candidatus Microgenomates bacterium]